MWSKTGFILLLPSLLTWFAAPAQGDEKVPLSISSSVFEHMGGIPSRYTCEGRDVSPPLSFAHVPNATRSLALIVDDPDASSPARTHWIVYNMPPDISGTGEAAGSPIVGAMEGENDRKGAAYGGPCPSAGRHRYFFRLYALDTVLPDLHRPTAAELARAMEGHVLEQATLIGTYRKED